MILFKSLLFIFTACASPYHICTFSSHCSMQNICELLKLLQRFEVSKVAMIFFLLACIWKDTFVTNRSIRSWYVSVHIMWSFHTLNNIQHIPLQVFPLNLQGYTKARAQCRHDTMACSLASADPAGQGTNHDTYRVPMLLEFSFIQSFLLSISFLFISGYLLPSFILVFMQSLLLLSSVFLSWVFLCILCCPFCDTS